MTLSFWIQSRSKGFLTTVAMTMWTKTDQEIWEHGSDPRFHRLLKWKMSCRYASTSCNMLSTVKGGNRATSLMLSWYCKHKTSHDIGLHNGNVLQGYWHVKIFIIFVTVNEFRLQDRGWFLVQNLIALHMGIWRWLKFCSSCCWCLWWVRSRGCFHWLVRILIGGLHCEVSLLLL